MAQQHVPELVQSTHPRRGLATALLIIPVGVAVWVFLWQFGFIASVVAWGIAAGAAWLYSFGAKSEVTKSVVPYLVGIILLGVLLAFLGGMASDGWAAYTSEEIGGQEGLLSGDFISFFVANLATAELWQSYVVDIIISLAFAALGAGGIIYKLYKKEPQPTGV